METNVCDVNHLDADVLLPPRKRLLAGLKKQSSDFNPRTPPPPPASSNGLGSEFDTRLKDLLKSHLSNPSLSKEEIIEASKLAAAEAAKVAKTARALAEEKAAKAAKAIATAKSALAFVTDMTEEVNGRGRQSKKNKTKKHVAVQTLYNKNKGVESCRTDEELAKKLHRAINSSPRISKSSNSDMRNHKHKRQKTMPLAEKAKVSNGVPPSEGNQLSTSNTPRVAGVLDSEGSSMETDNIRIDLNIKELNKDESPTMENGKAIQLNKAYSPIMENREEEANNSKETAEEYIDDISSIGKKKGRFKQKKLPLSICNFRDQANPKEELKSKSSPPLEASMISGTANNKSLFPVERTSVWKCQAFKAPACVKQNKVMQS